jgi:heme-degrading monooxygenase HmoA
LGASRFRAKGAVMITVLFKSRPSASVNAKEYGKLGKRLADTVAAMPGFVALDVFDNAAGETLIVAQFESEAAEALWRDHPDHAAARARRADFYSAYDVQVCQVIRRYDWKNPAAK